MFASTFSRVLAVEQKFAKHEFGILLRALPCSLLQTLTFHYCYNSARLEGVQHPFRIDDFPGHGDVNDICGGLTALAYDLSAVQVHCFSGRERACTIVLSQIIRENQYF